MAQTKYIISLIDRVTKTANRIGQSLTTIDQNAVKVANSIKGIHLIAAGAAVGGIFKLGAELESTRLKFNTLTGSVEKGTKLFEELTTFANSTPFSNQALNKNASTLLAFGVKTENVTKTLRMLGDVAAGDQNKLESLTLAFAQSQSAGKLMGQDLLQFINAGFNPLQIIAEQTGQSMAYLKDQMSKGAISADMVRQAFEIATGKGGRFYDLTNKMAGTMAGKWSTAMGKGKFLIAEFGLSLKSLFVPALESVINFIDKASEYLKRNQERITKIIPIVIRFTAIIGGLIVALKIWIGVQKILNAVMAANPIGLIIVAIAALVTAITVLWERSEKFRGTIYGVWEVLKYLKTMIGDVIKSIIEFDLSWSNLGETIKDLVTKRIKLALEALNALQVAFVAFSVGDLKTAGKAASKALGNLAPGAALIGGAEGYKKIGEKAAELFRIGYEKGKIKESAEKLPAFESNFPGAGELATVGLTPELKKLQAEGVVSGGIKTFNININQVTGVETLSSTTIEESADTVGDKVTQAIIKALADIRNIG